MWSRYGAGTGTKAGTGTAACQKSEPELEQQKKVRFRNTAETFPIRIYSRYCNGILSRD
jgi:hypothetical protein